MGGIVVAKTDTKKKKNVKKEADKEITNGAFILLLIITVLIAGVVGWVLGSGTANLLS